MNLFNPFILLTFFTQQQFIKNLYQKDLLEKLNSSIPIFHKLKHIKEYKSVFDKPEYIPDIFKHLDF